jgi:hypothetical protein
MTWQLPGKDPGSLPLSFNSANLHPTSSRFYSEPIPENKGPPLTTVCRRQAGHSIHQPSASPDAYKKCSADSADTAERLDISHIGLVKSRGLPLIARPSNGSEIRAKRLNVHANLILLELFEQVIFSAARQRVRSP